MLLRMMLQAHNLVVPSSEASSTQLWEALRQDRVLGILRVGRGARTGLVQSSYASGCENATSDGNVANHVLRPGCDWARSDPG